MKGRLGLRLASSIAAAVVCALPLSASAQGWLEAIERARTLQPSTLSSLSALGGSCNTASTISSLAQLNGTLADAGTVSTAPTGEWATQARAIENAFTETNDWLFLRSFTTPERMALVRALTRIADPARADQIFVTFWRDVLDAQMSQPEDVRAWIERQPDDWLANPTYEAYVQYFGVPESKSSGSFASTGAMVPYLSRLGFHNLSLRPHYTSPGLDDGYDVTEFRPDSRFGGENGWNQLMQVARRDDVRVIVDFPGNHVAVNSDLVWLAKSGDPLARSMLQPMGDWQWERVEHEGGDVFAVYRNKTSGQEWRELLIFPDVKENHLTRLSSTDPDHYFHSFYEFQLDLDATHPVVLDHHFRVIAGLLNQGVLGIRMDAMAHWVKIPGTRTDGHLETHALQALYKAFVLQVSPRARLIPEVVRHSEEAARYLGDGELRQQLLGYGVNPDAFGRSLEGDAIYNFEQQAAALEAAYLQTSAPIWDKAFTQPPLPDGTTYLNYRGHHDERYIGLMREGNRPSLREYFEARWGKVYKPSGNEAMSAGGREADFLERNPERIATAHFAQYLLNGVPAIYYGDEIGATGNTRHASLAARRITEMAAELGVEIDPTRAFDPRQLHRGPISAQQFQMAAQSGYLPLVTIRALNELWEARPSLRSNLLTEMTNGNDSVLSLVKFTDDGSDTPLVGLANLSGTAPTVRIPLAELAAKTGHTGGGIPRALTDVLAAQMGGDADVPVHVEDGALVVRMPAFGRHLLHVTW